MLLELLDPHILVSAQMLVFSGVGTDLAVRLFFDSLPEPDHFLLKTSDHIGLPINRPTETRNIV